MVSVTHWLASLASGERQVNDRHCFQKNRVGYIYIYSQQSKKKRPQICKRAREYVGEVGGRKEKEENNKILFSFQKLKILTIKRLKVGSTWGMTTEAPFAHTCTHARTHKCTCAFTYTIPLMVKNGRSSRSCLVGWEGLTFCPGFVIACTLG